MTRRRMTSDVAVRDELTDYFLSAESAQGLSSSFGPLVDVAMGGWGGAPDPERRVLRRHEVGKWETAATRARPVRDALLALPAVQRDALFAAFGPLDWSRCIDAAFGKGMGQKVAKAIGTLAGVALLTQAVARGFAADDERTEDAPRGPGLAGLVQVWREPVESLRGRVMAAYGGAPLLKADAWLYTAPLAHILRAARAMGIAPRGMEVQLPRERIWSRPPRSWNSAAGWLVATCIKSGDGREAEAIAAEAEALLKASVGAYGVAIVVARRPKVGRGVAA